MQAFTDFEGSFLLLIQEHLRVPALNGAMQFITHLGDTGAIWIAIALILLCIPRTRKAGLVCAAALIVNLLITNVSLKNIIQRIRPYDVMDSLKILVEAGILSEVIVKKEIPNKVGKRNVKAYVLKEDAFEDIFLDINFFTDELLAFFDLYDINKRFNNRKCCTLTVFNGKDKGKTFKINRNECAFIGRKGEKDLSHIASRKIILDNSYVTVSNVSKPHLKVFYEDGEWYILDDSSSNGTYLGDTLVLPGFKTPLRNNSFLKLSNGRGGIVFYCSF